VFLSAPEVVNRLQGPARLQVCTRKNLLDTLTRLDGNGHERAVDRPTSKLVARALEEAGIKESLRARRVGIPRPGRRSRLRPNARSPRRGSTPRSACCRCRRRTR
jgi:hypothetical protein